MNATKTVTVEIRHERNAGTHWVIPVGWEPKFPDYPVALFYDEGSLWSETEEELAIAIDHTDALCGDYEEVEISRLFWSTMGNCRFAGNVEIE